MVSRKSSPPLKRRYLSILLCALVVGQDLSTFLHIYDHLPPAECQKGIRAARVLGMNAHAIDRCVQIAIILSDFVLEDLCGCV